MTEHDSISVKKYEQLVAAGRDLTSEETEAVINHIRFSGQHDITFRFSTYLGDVFDAVKLAHYAAILQGEISAEQL